MCVCVCVCVCVCIQIHLTQFYATFVVKLECPLKNGSTTFTFKRND